MLRAAHDRLQPLPRRVGAAGCLLGALAGVASHPDLAAWQAVRDPRARLRLGLGQLYGWYRETEPMTANVLRDAQVLPALAPLGDAEAADLAAGLIELAADSDSTP